MSQNSKKTSFGLPLINAHTHAAMTAFRGMAEDLPLQKWLSDHIWPAERKMITPSFVRKETRKAILEMKKNGIGAFADMYFFEEEVAKVAKELEIRAVIGEAILDLPTPSTQNPEEAFKMTERLLEKYKDDPFIQVAVAPHSIYTVSEKNLLRAKKLARKHKTIFHIHLAETKNEFDTCLKDRKLTPVGYLEKLGILDERTLLAHCVWVSNQDMEIMAKRRVSVAHCPLSNLKLGSGIAPAAKMIKKGINVCLGTDGAASSNRLDVWEAGKIASLVQKGINFDPTELPAKTVVKMMTINGFKALGLAKIKDKRLEDVEKEIENRGNYNFIYHLNSNEMSFFEAN